MMRAFKSDRYQNNHYTQSKVKGKRDFKENTNMRTRPYT